MSVAYLRDRVTQNLEEYEQARASADSKVWVSISPKLDRAGATFDLTVGDTYFRNGVEHKILADGLPMRPGEMLVVYTQEEVALPLNMFGLITGKGRRIFQGLLVSTGKIDPGYSGRLLLGVFNASGKELTLQRGDALCECALILTEYHLQPTATKDEPRPSAKDSPVPFMSVLRRNLVQPHWVALIAAVVGGVAAGVIGGLFR